MSLLDAALAFALTMIDRVVDDARLQAALSGQPGKPETGP